MSDARRRNEVGRKAFLFSSSTAGMALALMLGLGTLLEVFGTSRGSGRFWVAVVGLVAPILLGVGISQAIHHRMGTTQREFRERTAAAIADRSTSGARRNMSPKRVAQGLLFVGTLPSLGAVLAVSALCSASWLVIEAEAGLLAVLGLVLVTIAIRSTTRTER